MKNSNILKFIFLGVIGLIMASCGKEELPNDNPTEENTSENRPCDNPVHAVILDYTLDGCGWVLLLDQGDLLEPVHVDWASLNIVPVHGLEVIIGYHEVSEATICMVGQPVEIDCAEKN